MKDASKKIISVVLIVAMMFVNNGFYVLADSIEKVVEENTLKQDESEKFYYEETLVEKEVTFEYEDLQESVETTTEEEKNSVKEDTEEVLDVENEIEIKAEDIEEKEEDELVDAANESSNEVNTNENILDENKNENIEENNNQEKVDEEEKIDNENSVEKTTIDEKEVKEINEVENNETKIEKDIVEEEATPSEVDDVTVEKENVEEKNEDEIISTESVVEVLDETKEEETNKKEEQEVATESNIENKDEEKIATESIVENMVEEVATVSEIIEVATKSEVEMATESIVEEKNKVYATVSVVNWRVKKILVATYSKAYTRITKGETGEGNLIKFANVVLVNDEGEEKVVRVPIKWKLEKRFTTNIQNDSNADLNNNAEVNAYIENKKAKKVKIPATSSVAEVVDKIKSEINDKNNEAVITVLNEAKEDDNEVIEEIEEDEVDEEIENVNVDEIDKEEETFKETEKVEENVVEEEKVNIKEEDFIEEIKEPTVAGFGDTEEVVEEVVEENKNIEDNYVYEEGFINAGKDDGSKQVKTIEIYSIDGEALSNEILNALNEDNEKNNNEEKNDEEIKSEKKVSGFFSLFGLNNKNDNKENVEEDINEDNFALGLRVSNIPKILTQINLGGALVEHIKGNHTIASLLDSSTKDVVDLETMFKGDDGKYDVDTWEPYYYNDQYHGFALDINREMKAEEQMDEYWNENPSLLQYATQNQVVMEGNYYLNDDVTVNKKWVIRPGKVLRICLNGRTLRFNLKKDEITEFFEEGYIGKAIDINGKIANDNNEGGGSLIICNCADSISTITAGADDGSKSVKGCKDGDYKKSRLTYERWKAHALINTDKVFIAGSNKNIVIGDTIIKNKYQDEVKVLNEQDERDYPDTTGDGSIISARELCVVVNTKMQNAEASRAIGTFINALYGRLIIYNSEFSNSKNKFGTGGAIAFNTKSTYMEKVTIKDSFAFGNGGMLYGNTLPYSFPGQIGSKYGAKGTLIQNCDFDNGTVNNDGGIMFLDDFGGDRRNVAQKWSQPVVEGCNQVNIISTKFNNSAKKSLASYQGGMITVKHKVIGYNSYGSIKSGNLNIVDCVFKDAKIDTTGNIISTNIYGGAIALCDDNRDRLIESVIIKGKDSENTFENCLVQGPAKNSGAGRGGYFSANPSFNGLSYGGAFYAKNVKDITFDNVKMNNNVSFAGANVYLDNSKLTLDKSIIIEGKGGTTSAYNPMGIRNYIITPAGGAVYLANAAKLIINGTNTIRDNLNAFFLDSTKPGKEATIEFNNGVYTNTTGNINVGEYLVGLSNKGNGRVIFNDTQIADHYFYGSINGGGTTYDFSDYRKDYYVGVPSGYSGGRENYSKIQFFGTKNYIKNNLENRKFKGRTGSTIIDEKEKEKETEVKDRVMNLDLRSSKSNLRLDLSNIFNVNANISGDGTEKIGLSYDVLDSKLYNGTLVYQNWSGTPFKGGSLDWNTRFSLDEGGRKELLNDNLSFVLLDNNIYLSRGAVRINYHSYIKGVASLEPGLVEDPSDDFKIPTPSELKNGGINDGKTIVGYMGIKKGETEYTNWNFATDIMELKYKINEKTGETEKVKEYDMIVVYTDDTINVKACGCKAGETCNHIEQPGVNHKDRGNAMSKTEDAKWKNYVIIGDEDDDTKFNVFNYKYIGDPSKTDVYNKYTQYALYGDTEFTKENALKYLNGRDLVLNLNGKKITINSEDGATFVQKVPGSPIDIGIVEDDSNDRYFINGHASTSQTAKKGKIEVKSKVVQQKALFYTNGNNFWLANTEISDLKGTAGSYIVDGEMEKLNITGCEFKNIGGLSVNERYTSFSNNAKQVYVKDTVIDNFVIPDTSVGKSLFTVNGDSKTKKLCFDGTTIKNCVYNAILVLIQGADGNFIASNSTIINNKFIRSDNTSSHIYALSGKVKLYNTEIIAAKDDQSYILYNSGADVTIAGKVVLKAGNTINSKGYFIYGTRGKGMKADANNKLASGSYIELCLDKNENKTFFTGWSAKYVENYNYIVEKGKKGSELPENWFYGTQRVFAPDAFTQNKYPTEEGKIKGVAPYIKGMGDLQEVCMGDNYAILNYYNDEYEIPEYACSFYQNIAGNYAGKTQLPLVQVGCLTAEQHLWTGTTSRTFRNVDLSEWIIENTVKGAIYTRKLVRAHVHKLCGCEGPCSHADGTIHTVEASYSTVISKEAFVDEIKRTDDGSEKRIALNSDITLDQNAFNEITLACETRGVKLVAICLNGNELTLESDVTKFTIPKGIDFIISNCINNSNQGSITTEGGLATTRNYEIFYNNATDSNLYIYNASFSNIKSTEPLITTTKGKTLLENVIIDSCEFNSYLGAIYQEDDSEKRTRIYLDNLTLSNNTAVDEPLLYFGDATLFNKENSIVGLELQNNKFNTSLIDLFADGNDVEKKIVIKGISVEDNKEYGTNNAKLMVLRKDVTVNLAGEILFNNNESSGGIIADDEYDGSTKSLAIGTSNFSNNSKGAVLVISSASQTYNVVFDNMAMFADNLNGAIKAQGGRIEFSDDAAFVGNKNLDVDGHGAALCIENNAEVIFDEESMFNENIAYSNGGAVYNEHLLTFNKSVSFASNSVTNGGASAIYSNLQNGEYTKIPLATDFLNNGNSNSGYVIEYVGDLNVERLRFDGNKGKGLIGNVKPAYDKPNTVKIYDVRVSSNSTTGAAFALDYLSGVNNEIDGIVSLMEDNSFGSLINLNGDATAKIKVQNTALYTRDKYLNTVIDIESLDKPEITNVSITNAKSEGSIMNIKSAVILEDVEISDNSVKKGAVILSSGSLAKPTAVSVKGNIKINDNIFNNIVINEGNNYNYFIIENRDDLKSDSSMSFYTEFDDVLALRNWDYIEHYDDPEAVGDYSMSPERKNRVVSDYPPNLTTGRYIYKVGGNSDTPPTKRVDLYLGKRDRFVTIKFTDGTLEANYAEQNVKAQTEVRIDRVKYGDWQEFRETSTGTMYDFKDPKVYLMSPKLAVKDTNNLYYAMISYNYSVIYSAGNNEAYSSLPDVKDINKTYKSDDKVQILSRRPFGGSSKIKSVDELDITNAWKDAGGTVYEWILDNPRIPLTEDMRWISFNADKGEIGIQTQQLSPSSQPAKLSAIWEPDEHIVKYMGIYDGRESTYSNVFDQKVKGNTYVTHGNAEDPTSIPYYKNDYDFVGYYAKYALGRGAYGQKKVPGNEYVLKDEDDITEKKPISIVIYAVWQRREGMVNFINVVNNKITEKKVKQFKTATFSMPDPIKDLGFDDIGLSFKAYHEKFNEATGEYGGKEYNIGDVVDTVNDSEFYIEWTGKAYTASYDPNGGTGKMNTETIKDGDSYKILKNAFTRSGFTFVNWKKSDTGKTYGAEATIPASEITVNFTLIAQWKQNSPGPTPGPTPGPSGGGGGGGNGGGGGGGNHQTQGFWRDNEFNPLTGVQNVNKLSFIVRVDGSIISPDGNIVGSIFNGDRVNADGSFTDNQNVTHYPDGRVMDPTGIVHNIDGTLTDKNGNVINPNGMVQQINNQLAQNQEFIDASGMRFLADGTKISPDGITYFPDGSTLFPDGTKMMADGSIVKPTTVTAQANGQWVKDQVTGKETFVKKDANGLQITAADEWVMQNNAGKEDWYAVDRNGFMITGWLKDAGEYYYLAKDGANKGLLSKGSVVIDGAVCKFDNDGKLVSGEPNYRDLTVMGAINHVSGIDGNWSTNAAGQRVFTMNIPMADGSNNKSTPKSWYMIDGDYYYFNEDGTPTTGLKVLDNKYYYFKEDGKMQEGGDIVVNNIKYTFDKATGACRQALPLS